MLDIVEAALDVASAIPGGEDKKKRSWKSAIFWIATTIALSAVFIYFL